LNNVENKGFKKGSTAAEVIREDWPTCPIVCVTGVKLTDIDSHKESLYEEVIEFHNISDRYKTILSIAASFQRMKKSPPQDKEGFIRLLGTPEDDKERLRAVIPKELKDNDFYSDDSLLLSISKWVRKTLIARPGFLYDRMWVATLAGIKETSFFKVEEIFKPAMYKGIFAEEGNERWWQSKIRGIIFSRFPENDSIYPWELGRLLPGVDETDFSKCFYSKEDYPESVAYTDESAQTRAPMRLRYTVPHPGFEKSLFFEEIRMMAETE